MIQTCQHNVKVIFPRGQADNYGKQNGVRIPRQILISRGHSGPIRHHFGDSRIQTSLRTADAFPVVASTLFSEGEKRRLEMRLLFAGYIQT